MSEKRRLNLSFSMASAFQREVWEILMSIPSGQRTEAVCRMIHDHQSQAQMLAAIRSTIREELSGIAFDKQRIAAQEQAEDMDESVLGFLRALQEGDMT